MTITNERVEKLIEGMIGHEGYKYYVSEEAGKELREAGILLEFVDSGVKWKRT